MKYIACIMFFITALLVNAQIINNEGKQTLIKGFIKDGSGTPIEVEIEIKNKAGNKVRVKSNSMTGAYEQVLQSGEKYTFTFIANNVLREERIVEIPDSKDKFTELPMSFKVTKLEKGAQLKVINIFTNNTISTEGKTQLDELKPLLRFNRAIDLEIYTNSQEKLVALLQHIESMGAIKTKIKVLLNEEQEEDCNIKIGNVTTN